MTKYGFGPDTPYYNSERESDLFLDFHALITGLNPTGLNGEKPLVWRDHGQGGVYVGPLDALSVWERDRLILALDYAYCMVMEVPAEDSPRGILHKGSDDQQA